MVQTSEQLVSTDAERYLLIYMIVVLVVVTALVVLFFIVFQKRKNKLLLDKINQQRKFEEEISKTQLEIQEQTLKNVGQELHDNVGQILSFATMQLSLVSSLVEDTVKEKVDDTKDIVLSAIEEVRTLSKTLNADVILSRGFQESIQTEMDRLNKMNLIQAELISTGDKGICNNNGDSIILFRILQEFISNSVKYSEASLIKISLDYKPDDLYIVAEDDGLGFDIDTVIKGSGLINMESRAALTQTAFSLVSKPGEGTKLSLHYPLTIRALKTTT